MNRSIVLVASLVLAASCKKDEPNNVPTPEPKPVEKAECDGIDETNLEVVAQCFYAAKKASTQRRFYSRAALEELAAAGDENPSDLPADLIYSDVRVARQETVSGHMFAAVSRTLRQRQPDGGISCADTKTFTWLREDGKWRRLGGTDKIAETAEKRNESGDHSGAVESAEEWLKLDPLSISAYYQLGSAVARGARGKAPADIVRAVLSIDSRNSTAIFLAILLNEDVDVRQSFLERLDPLDCSIAMAVFNVAASLLDARRPADALRFIEQHPESKLSLMRLKALEALGRTKDAMTVLTQNRDEIRNELQGHDPRFVAYWSSVLASIALTGGDKQQAREWVDFGLEKDPSNTNLARLLRRTRK